MRSPFGIFRKHGTILTAALVVLSIFAFTLADFLRPEHFPALLAMMAFGLLFFLFGQPSGNGGTFALLGVVVGLVVAAFLPNFFGPTAAATTTVGNLSEDELRKKMEERRIANQFIYEVYQTGHGPRPTGQDLLAQFGDNPQLQQMIMQSVQQQQAFWDRGLQNYAFAPLQESPEDARLSTTRMWVMAQQADEIGIRVSNDAITKYLQEASSGKLTAEQFTALRKELTMSEADLYDLLRYHIKAREYQILTYPYALTPPEKMWEFYKRATIEQSMELARIPVSAFTDQVALPQNPQSDAELIAFFDRYKDRFPEGELDPQEGWVQPVEALSPEPAFGVPRAIRLAYFTGDLSQFQKTPPQPTEEEIARYYEENRVNFPNPAYQRALEDDAPPEPLTPEGPAVAQKPRDTSGPATADKPEYLPLDRVRNEISSLLYEEAEQKEIAKAREIIDERMSRALSKMNELSAAYQRQGEERKTPQQISDELNALAKELELGYTVPQSAWTPAEMTATKIGQAVEVDINPAASPGEPKVTPRTDGSTVVFQVFTSEADERFRPNQAMASDGTRYAYWKIEDHPQHIPDWTDPGVQEKVIDAWKLHKAREIAQTRAEELAQLVRDSEDRNMFNALEEQTITGVEEGMTLEVRTTNEFTWMEPLQPQSRSLDLGTVAGVPKAGHEFMETAFNELEEGDIGVLVNADGTEYYVGKVIERKYGEGEDLASLRESFLNQTESPGHRTMSVLVNQESQKLFRDWVMHFDRKFQIQVAPPQTS